MHCYILIDMNLGVPLKHISISKKTNPSTKPRQARSADKHAPLRHIGDILREKKKKSSCVQCLHACGCHYMSSSSRTRNQHSHAFLSWDQKCCSTYFQIVFKSGKDDVLRKMTQRRDKKTLRKVTSLLEI